MARVGRSSRSDVPLGEAHSVEENATVGSTPVTVDVVRDEPEGEALYWFGTLPAEGKQPLLLQPAEGQPPNFEREDGRVEVLLTALEAWYPKFKGQPPMWLGRCRWYQNLGVTGIEFVAFSEERVREAANESQRFLMAWPGKVAKFSDPQLRAILEAVRNHSIRPKSENVADIVNYLHGHMTGCKGPLRSCTCPEIERELSHQPPHSQRALGSQPERRRLGDIPMGDYVYLRRLTVGIDYDPKIYYRLAPSMEQFLQHPPEALSADLLKLEKEAEPAVAAG